MTVSVKSLQKQLIAAVAMVLVAMIALGSSTYAWFVSNNSVTATTSNISAQSNSPFLIIYDDTTGQEEADGKTIVTSTVGTATPLYPAQVVNDSTNFKFQSAYASVADAATEKGGTRFDVPDPTTPVNGAAFALKYSVKITSKAGSFTNLNVTGVTVAGTGSEATGLNDAVCVMVKSGTNWQVWKNGAKLTQYADTTTSVTGNGTNLAATVDTSTDVPVDIYVFYDGSHANVKTTNIENLLQSNVTVTFGADTVNVGA